MLFFNVWSILPDSSKFLAVLIATFLADFRNFFPKGLLAVALINFGVDLITDFPIGSKVRNNELKTPPIPLPLYIRTPL